MAPRNDEAPTDQRSHRGFLWAVLRTSTGPETRERIWVPNRVLLHTLRIFLFRRGAAFVQRKWPSQERVVD